MAGLNCKFK